jgi:hypothetical protein
MAPIAEEKLQKGDRGGARRKILRLGLATFGGTVLRQCDFKRLALGVHLPSNTLAAKAPK